MHCFGCWAAVGCANMTAVNLRCLREDLCSFTIYHLRADICKAMPQVQSHHRHACISTSYIGRKSDLPHLNSPKWFPASDLIKCHNRIKYDQKWPTWFVFHCDLFYCFFIYSLFDNVFHSAGNRLFVSIYVYRKGRRQKVCGWTWAESSTSVCIVGQLGGVPSEQPHPLFILIYRCDRALSPRQFLILKWHRNYY